jgi:hypothetical protein
MSVAKIRPKYIFFLCVLGSLSKFGIFISEKNLYKKKIHSFITFVHHCEAVDSRSGGVKVVFFVSGDPAFVSMADGWRPFTEAETDRLVQDPDSNRGSFSRALAEMKSIVDGQFLVHRNNMYGAARHLGPVSASRLMQENAYNTAAFKEKMYLKPNKRWGCRQCIKWETKLEMRAKRHARSCGERPREPRVRSQVATMACSALGCDQKFARRRELHLHYRREHADRARPYRCQVCRHTFALSWLLRRHSAEFHSDLDSQKCPHCDYTTTRRHYLLGLHMARKHPELVEAVHGSEEEDLVIDPVAEPKESPGVSRLTMLIDEMVSRQEQLGPAELQRLQNIRANRRWLLATNLAEESGAGSNSVVAGAPSVRQKKRKTASVPAAGEQRKSARLSVNPGLVEVEEGEATLEGEVDEGEELLEGGVEEGVELLEGGVEEGEELLEGGVEEGEELLEGGVEELIGELIDELVGLAPYGGKDPLETCEICGSRKRQGSNMTRHRLTMHTAGGEPVPCTKNQFCQKTFITKWDMFVHRATCKYICPRCGKGEPRWDSCNILL